MKSKGILVFVLFMTVSLNNVFGDDTDVPVTATVQSALNVSTTTDVAFGIISEGVQSYLPANENDGTAAANLGVDATPGEVNIQGESAADIQLTFSTATLTDADGLSPITFTPTIYSGSTEITSGSTTIQISGGNIDIDVGGTLGAITGSGTWSTGNTNGEPLNVLVQYIDV